MWDILKIMYEDAIKIKRAIINTLNQEIELTKGYEGNIKKIVY